MLFHTFTNHVCPTYARPSILTSSSLFNIQKRHVNWWRSPTEDTIPKETVDAFYSAMEKTSFHFHKICPYIKFGRPGIYKLTNNKNGMIYVGMSVNMYFRIKQHVKDGFNYKYAEIKTNQGRFSLVSKGIAESDFDFRFDVLEVIPRKGNLWDDRELKKILKARETYYIEKLRPYEREIGYNVVKQ